MVRFSAAPSYTLTFNSYGEKSRTRSMLRRPSVMQVVLAYHPSPDPRSPSRGCIRPRRRSRCSESSPTVPVQRVDQLVYALRRDLRDGERPVLWPSDHRNIHRGSLLFRQFYFRNGVAAVAEPSAKSGRTPVGPSEKGQALRTARLKSLDLLDEPGERHGLPLDKVVV